ncbi:MAG: radical SAM protein [Deltaproteobacteria bacterium]|nr:radical SAM protein [Deltaproteobacteria bacterium]
MAEPRPLFCAKPFKRFEVSRRQGGLTHLCCSAWLKRAVGNLKEQSVAAVWNSVAAQEIRASILDGSFSYCDRQRCPFLQTVSGPVSALADVKDPELLAAVRERWTELPYGPRDISCAYDRSCNLACPSCRTAVVVETDREQEIVAIQRKLNDEALKDAHVLSITGSGDPFGSPYFRRWLQSMQRADMPRLRSIHLHTNAQLWTPGTWATIPAEIRALVGSTEISIDAATAATYAVNRQGGDFERLLRNLELVRQLRREGPLRRVKISMVVQENNFTEMPEFVRLGQRLDVDCVYFSQLVDWQTFAPDELAARSVHRPEHPRHRELVAVLKDRIFDDPKVDLGNLTEPRKRGLFEAGAAE